MIKLYYTGAQENGAEQKEIRKSLGGFISGTVIPNNRKNNLFRDETYYSLVKGKSEVICIAIKNELSTDLQNLTLYADVPEGYILKAAVVEPSISECGAPIFEQLKTQEELPYYAEFNDITGAQNEIALGDLEAQKYLGLFLMRIKEQNNNNKLNCDNLDAADVNINTTKTIKLNFDWA